LRRTLRARPRAVRRGCCERLPRRRHLRQRGRGTVGRPHGPLVRVRRRHPPDRRPAARDRWVRVARGARPVSAPSPADTGLLFIFDMDDVLYDYDWRARQAALMQHTGLTGDELWSRWWQRGHEESAEAGDPDTAAGYLERFNRELSGTLT